MSLVLTNLSGFAHKSLPNYRGVDLIPAMTSDTTDGVTMAASSIFTVDYPAWRGANNDNSGFAQAWFSAAGLPQWISVDFGVDTVVYRYALQEFVGGTGARMPQDFTLEGSSDNSTWVVLDTQTSQTSWTGGLRREYTLTTPQIFRHYRVNITANNGDSLTGFGEMEILG